MKISPEYFLSRPLAELHEENLGFFRELEPASYESSYANPALSAAVFGNELRGLMSAFHLQNRQHIRYASRHERFEMLDSHRTFIDAFAYLKKNKAELAQLTDIITSRFKKDRSDEYICGLRESVSPEFDLAGSGDLVFPAYDPRYLLLSGQRVSNIEIDTSRFINKLPQADIDTIARTVAGAYARGFIVDNKDRTGKTVCGIWGSLGQERIYRRLISFLKEEGFTGVLKSLSTPPLNRQYWFDHQFDAALFLTPQLTAQWEAAYQSALETCKKLYPAFSGGIYFETFGEKPFSPKMKTGNTSFSAIAFPSTEIGDLFREIFMEMIAINTVDPDLYSAIQQEIIDVLDTATFVRIKGKGGNRTDLTVQLRPLAHPEKETNFGNCGADVNIPVGEVFTTPRLEGTNGTLNINKSYLFGYFFRNLTLVFKDGYITDYDCANHGIAEENKKYIEESLLFPHKTLPMGEFAIGTNTRAFAMSRRFDLLDKLPVLIIEKMGPHFAIGDRWVSSTF